MQKIELARVAGPFDQIPSMHKFRLSPIGIVYKKDGGWRLIHYLLFHERISVNDVIDRNYCTFRYRLLSCKDRCKVSFKFSTSTAI